MATPKARAVKPPAIEEVDELDRITEDLGYPPPEPTAMRAVWFPVTVTFPGEDTVHRRAKVFATPEGLYVYLAVPTDRSGKEPDWYSPILPGAAQPPTGWAARNGFTIQTVHGPVAMTAEGGCGCSHPLKRWNPPYADRNVAW